MKGRWGWRPILMSLFISVFVVACDVADNTTTTVPTESFRITLTLRQPRAPTDTPSSAAALTQEPTPASDFAPEALSASVVDLVARPPRCYVGLADTSICLGVVENPLPYAIHRVMIRVRVSIDHGTAIIERATAIQQRIIPPESSAPYYVTFPIEISPSSQVEATVISAAVTTEHSPTLNTEDEASGYADGKYRVTVTVYNPGPADVIHVRAFVTLLDADDRVAGYRIAYLAERLPAGGRIPVHIDVIPQQSTEGLSHMLYVEAQDARTTP